MERTSPETRRNPRHKHITIKLRSEYPDVYFKPVRASSDLYATIFVMLRRDYDCSLFYEW